LAFEVLSRARSVCRRALHRPQSLRGLIGSLGLGAALALGLSAEPALAQAPAQAPGAATTVTDIVGHTVQIPAKVDHILLGEGRFLYTLAILDGDAPLARIAGWQGELAFADPNGWVQYQRRYPAINRIPVIGKSSEESVSFEKTLSTRPDIAIFGLGGHGPGPQNSLVQALQKAGVPVVFIDFRASPVAHTLASIRILGRAVHREAQAEAYAQFYEAHFNRIRSRVGSLPDSRKPRVFAELLAGVWDGCCHTVGQGNIGEFITAAGGINIAQGKVPGAIGDLNLESVIAQDPDIYIATGSRPQGNRLMLKAGAGVSLAEMQSSLRALTSRTGFATLKAVRTGHAYGLWHNFYDAPTNILAIEAMAKWFHPDLFPDVDPQQTLNEINRRFLHGLPMQGTYWGALSSTTVAAH
jgi:iron complex transport system substrate-binding protein